ncbi:glycosyltransferase family 2 protein [Marisediminicola sp. LYQ134]|uniref:glycosyltransferase family 2 protein n=1 Tax=Marisediminicola sp. LYQ134 TaxID=3391061 RepID=UPI0039830034
MSLVSVVLPLHNAEGYLDRAISQLEALDASIPYEFIVIDDHSTDGTAARVKQWVDSSSSRVTIHHATGAGVANARNEAMRLCSGEFVWFVDADDSWDSRIVTEMAAAIGSADIAACNARKVNDTGDEVGLIDDAPRLESISGEEAFLRMLEGTLQGHLWNKLFRRESLPFDMFPSTRAHSDMGALLALLPRLASVQLVPASLYAYALHAGSILNSRKYNWDDLERCYEIAAAGAATLHDAGRTRRALVSFKYRNVVIPTANEIARRRTHYDSSEARRLRRRNRDRMSFSEVFELRGSTGSMARSVLLAASPTLYDLAYRATKSRRWTAIV